MVNKIIVTCKRSPSKSVTKGIRTQDSKPQGIIFRYTYLIAS